MWSRATILALVWSSAAWAEEPAAAESDEASAAPAEPPAADDAPEPAPPAPDPDAGWVEVGVDADFGSAVETGLEDRADAGELPPELEGLIATAAAFADRPAPPPRPASRIGFRPLLGAGGVVPTGSTASAWGGFAGARVSHQWWTRTENLLRPAGETRIDGVGAFGGVSGWGARVESLHGAWIGPVGLAVGGQARWDARSVGGAEVLPAALGAGPGARLAVEAGPITPWVGASAAWLVVGDRPGLQGAPWDEVGLQGGLVVDRRPLGLRLTGGWRQVAVGSLWDATLGLHVRLL